MNVGKCSITFLSKYINQIETDIQNYAVPSLFPRTPSVEEESAEEVFEEESKEHLEIPEQQFLPLQKCRPIDTPRVCLWLFMEKDDLHLYLSLTSKRKMKEMLNEKFGSKLKGCSRIILIEFLIDATIFCVNSKFDLEQTSAVLGMYYLTHKYFTDHLYICPEDVLSFFKQFLMYHSLLFAPTHIKLFEIEECKGILLHFCSLYLRHMPLIRILTLPNFGFELDYQLEPDVDKKAKKGTKQKGKDSGEKKSKMPGKKSKAK